MWHYNGCIIAVIKMKQPSDLLNAISKPEGGQVVLVTGAGCSVEPPTNLPLSKDLSIDIHRRLVEDGILDSGDCDNPQDLSKVTDAVWAKTGHQHEFVRRFPINDFRFAEPNFGHLLAAALLYEQALGCIMTLNFDLAFTNALSALGARGINVISKPEDYGNLGLSNLIYLHRNVDADADYWVLRSEALEKDWNNGWEKVITERVVSTPVTVFVGLGTQIGVLEESTLRILHKLRGIVKVYQVDPEEVSESSLFEKLGLSDDEYLQMTWCKFVELLAIRLVHEHQASLEQACSKQIQDHGWEEEDIHGLCNRLIEDNLLKIGKIRARWTINPTNYLPNREINPKLIADLLIAVGFIERNSGSQAIFHPDGTIEFQKDSFNVGYVIAANGQGYTRWQAIEQKIKQSPQYHVLSQDGTIRVIVSGAPSSRMEEVATPENIIWEGEPDSIIPGQSKIKMYNIDLLREEPDLIKELFS